MELENHRVPMASAGLLVLMFLIGASIKDSSMFGSTVAAWVQAFGSVIAIFASVVITISIDQKAAKRLRDDRAAEAAAHYKAGRDALLVAQREVGQVRFHFDNAQGNSAAFDNGPRAAEVARGIDMLNYYMARGALTPALVIAFLSVKKVMTDLLVLLQSYDQSAGRYYTLAAGLAPVEGVIADAIRTLDEG